MEDIGYYLIDDYDKIWGTPYLDLFDLANCFLYIERKEVETSELGVDKRWKALEDCKTMI